MSNRTAANTSSGSPAGQKPDRQCRSGPRSRVGSSAVVLLVVALAAAAAASRLADRPVDQGQPWAQPDSARSTEEESFRTITVDADDADHGVFVDIEPSERAVALRGDFDSTEVAVRSQSRGQWSLWTRLETGDDEGPDGTEPGSEGGQSRGATTGLVWFGAGVDRIEVVAQASGTVEVFAIRPGDDPRPPSVAGPQTGTKPIALALGAAPRPTIRPRSDWATAAWNESGSGCSGGPSVSRNLSALVVHHTVNTNTYSAAEVDDLLRSFYTLHVRINGWCDVGYNFVIDRFGTIWEARTNSLRRPVIGGHAKGFNGSTLGVAMLGQFHPSAWPPAAKPTEAMRTSLLALARWRLEPYGVDPLGKTWLYNTATSSPLRLAGQSWHQVPTVVGHRDLGLTSCPGDYGYATVKTLPESLARNRPDTAPLSLWALQGADHGPGFVSVNATGALRPGGSTNPWDEVPGRRSGAGAVAVDGSLAGGHVLYDDGTLAPYGAGPTVGYAPAGDRRVVDLASNRRGGGWVLAANGTLHPFGGASPATVRGTVSAEAVAVSIDPKSASGTPVGYVLLADGNLLPVGDGPQQRRVALARPAVDLTLTWSVDDVWGWILDAGSTVVSLDGATTLSPRPNHDPVAVVSSDGEPGGWVVDSAGQYWAFGEARRVLPLSTDVLNADNPDKAVVDAAQIGIVVSEAFLEQSDARYVTALYKLLLGRAPTPAEVERRVTQLENGVSRERLVTPMMGSAHWTGSVIDRMYTDVLGRRPDPRGRRYWLERIKGGMSYQALGIYFYGSAEYAARAGSNQAYVASLYQNLLHREPDEKGLRFWTDALDNRGAWPPDVVHGFYVSRESRRDRVAANYRRVLGRNPTAAERDAGVALLATEDDVILATELVASAEFYLRAVD